MLKAELSVPSFVPEYGLGGLAGALGMLEETLR